MKLDKLGWIIAAGMAGALAMSGFQGSSLKLATCDIEKVFNGSSIRQANTDELVKFAQTRETIITFLANNREMNPLDAKSYVDISLHKTLNDSDRTKLQQISTDAATQVQKSHELMQKTSPTADEQRQLSDFASKRSANEAYAQQLSQVYTNDVSQERDRLRVAALERVRKSIRSIAAKQGYSIIFTVDAAPFAANDITDEVQKDLK